MQVCHGKAAPLRRIQPGDPVVHYSPTAQFQAKIKLQAFAAIGIVTPGAPYQADMGGGFCPFRRDAHWLQAREAPIQPLLHRLTWTSDQRNWGYTLRFGLIEVYEQDQQIIARAMGTARPA